MDPEVVIIGEDGTEHVFPAGFDPMKAAAIVRGGQPPKPSAEPGTPGAATMATGATLGAMSAAPGIVSGLNTAAQIGAKVAGGKIPGIRMKAPGVMAMGAAGQLMHGDVKGAATTGAGAVAMSQVPKALGMLQQLTEPATRMLPNGVKVALKSGGGPLARGAGALSKAAGAAAIPATMASTAYDLFKLVTERMPELLESERIPPDVREELRKAFIAPPM